MERTLVLIKPDAVERKLIGELISRFERKNFSIIGLKLIKLNKETAEEFYSMHKNKPFFNDLIEFITSLPVVAMVLEGNNAVSIVRKMMGALEPIEAHPGTIRGDYTIDKQKNLIHGSDSIENAEREINIIFKPDELYSANS